MKITRLRVEKLTKYFYGKKVLEDITFEVRSGSFSTILGPAGSGKTTLLRIIAGVEKPDNGKIYLDDRDVTYVAPTKRNIALVYQTFALYPHLKVFDNIASPLKAKKLSISEIKEKVSHISELLGIKHLLDRYPRELSGGEKQRVALARALVREAKLYLFDEPLTNLDYKLRETARTEFKKICKLFRATLIYATPDPIDALTMSDDTYVLYNGKLLQGGPVRQVYDLVTDIDVAKIFSYPSINLINAEVEVKDSKTYLKTPFISIELSFTLNPGKYILGIRPQDLCIISEKDYQSPSNSFRARLHLTYIVGSETIAYAEVEGIDLILHLPYIYRISESKNIMISINTDRIFLFDEKSLRRVYP
ncbi:MAG: ABC transporter ATP-binding protein [Nitrososphaerota archaeon]